ncbi:MAG: MoxR family ATPase [Dehalococcoidales bacterium]|nr:MoxR family ATPase [Dehalococcoidales bacterium]
MTTDSTRQHHLVSDIIAEVSKVVIGKSDIKDILLIALLSQGHVLIEGLPGTAKTTVARTFANAIGGTFKRVQGTPDMLPADILGFYLYRPDGSATFMPGPIFANVVLADELNRTTPRTQSALLEAMQEQQVTIERETHHLEQPFILIASQIPYGGVGTSPLSDVQADRFMFRVWSPLPSIEEEDCILREIDAISTSHISAVATPEDIIQLQQEVKKVHTADNVRRYILDIIDKLRHNPDISHAPGPRASIALLKSARARAFLNGRDFVIPDDIKTLAIPVLAHRLRLSSEAEMDNITIEAIIKKILRETAVPKEGITAEAETTAATLPEPYPDAVEENNPPDSTAATSEKAETAAPPTASTAPPNTIPTTARETIPESRGPAGNLTERDWILIILALVIATIMITIGLLSLR